LGTLIGNADLNADYLDYALRGVGSCLYEPEADYADVNAEVYADYEEI
jgi:hypothetical protein